MRGEDVEKVRRRETRKARFGGLFCVEGGAGARTRGLRRAFAANEGFGGLLPQREAVFSVIPYI